MMLDEAPLVPELAGLESQAILERCERANPVGKLDEDPPGCCRKMKPGRAFPAERKEAPCENEQNEHKVRDEDEVREQTVEHEGRAEVNYRTWATAAATILRARRTGFPVFSASFRRMSSV